MYKHIRILTPPIHMLAVSQCVSAHNLT